MGSAERRRAAARESRGASAPPRALSEGEHEVMTMLARGAIGSEITEALFISAETMRSRTRTARTKLGAKTRTHAIALAVHSGLIDMERPAADRGEAQVHRKR